MAINEERIPVLVGCGQYTVKEIDPDKPLKPVDLIEEASRRAAFDCGLGDSLFKNIQAIYSPSIAAPQTNNVPMALADRLGAKPSESYYTTIGGNTPQWLTTICAERISRGELKTALLASGELLAGIKSLQSLRSKKSGPSDNSAEQSHPPPVMLGDARNGTNSYEINHGLAVPVQVYPIFENALRVHYERSIDEHQQKVGELYENFSQVAADHPDAWFKKPSSVESLITPSAKNRYIGFPYTKFLNSMIYVNQAAAVVITSVAEAKRLGISEDRWVYLHGAGDAHDHWFPTERENFHSSPGITLAGQKAMQMANRSIDKIDFFDLYSCFPSAVEIARDSLGIPQNDPRRLTVTGGLRFFGGPGNNYPMHSIATMMDVLRKSTGSYGLVTGLGWHITKHSVGIYSTEPMEKPWQREDPKEYQSIIDNSPKPEIEESPDGKATVETYTVLYDREGKPEKGIIVGRLNNNKRFIANTAADQSLLTNMTEEEPIGKTGKVKSGSSINLFDFD